MSFRSSGSPASKTYPCKPPPAEVTLSRADGTLTATWNAPANAAAYHVTYTDNNGQSWSLGAMDHAQTTWTLSNADNDATYVVGVRARNSADDWSGWINSAPSGPYNATPPPGAVASVTVSRADGTLTAAWNAPANAAAYHVTYTDNNGQSWSLGAMDHAPTTWTLDTADNDATYVVAVRARNSANDWSGWTNSPAAGPYVPPTPQVSLTAARGSGGDSATVAWTPYDGDDFHYYRYYRFVVCSDAQYSGSSCSGTVYKSDAYFNAATTGPVTVSDLDADTGYGVILQVWRTGGTGALKRHATLPAPVTITVTDVTATTATVSIGNWGDDWYYRTEGGAGAQQQGGACHDGDAEQPDGGHVVHLQGVWRQRLQQHRRTRLGDLRHHRGGRDAYGVERDVDHGDAGHHRPHRSLVLPGRQGAAQRRVRAGGGQYRQRQPCGAEPGDDVYLQGVQRRRVRHRTGDGERLHHRGHRHSRRQQRRQPHHRHRGRHQELHRSPGLHARRQRHGDAERNGRRRPYLQPEHAELQHGRLEHRPDGHGERGGGQRRRRRTQDHHAHRRQHGRRLQSGEHGARRDRSGERPRHRPQPRRAQRAGGRQRHLHRASGAGAQRERHRHGQHTRRPGLQRGHQHPDVH